MAKIEFKIGLEQRSKEEFDKALIACERLNNAYKELALAMSDFKEICDKMQIEFETKE